MVRLRGQGQTDRFALHYFHFSWRNDRAPAARGQRRQIHFRDPPAAMAQQPPERRMAGDGADQLDRRRTKAGFDGNRLPLLGGDYWFERQVMVNRLPAAFMHIARGGADLSILIRRNVLGDEIYQSPVTLQ